jgi:uncharacterized protein YdeI (YjbR/CyaY-like superfamily)
LADHPARPGRRRDRRGRQRHRRAQPQFVRDRRRHSAPDARRRNPLSRDERIDTYIAKAAPFARPILDHVRARVQAVVPDAVETLKWSSPAFTVDGKILLILAAFKAHAAINFWRGQEIGDGSPKAGAMGQFGKLTSIDDLPSDQRLDAMIREAAALARTAPAPRKTKHVPKPPPAMHPEFAAALTKAPKAKAALDTFSPSAQRDYLEWIAEAKQEATRQKRIADAVDWLSEGKKRHWKYENC